MFILPYYFYFVLAIYYFFLTNIDVYFYSISQPSLWETKFVTSDLCILYNVIPWNILSQDTVFKHTTGCTKKLFLVANHGGDLW